MKMQSKKTGKGKTIKRLLKYVISFQVDKEDLLLLTEEKNAKNAVRKCFKDSELQVLIVRDGDETRTFRL